MSRRRDDRNCGTGVGQLRIDIQFAVMQKRQQSSNDRQWAVGRISTVLVRCGLSVALLALIALLAGGCATSPTGRSQLLLVPPAVAIEASAAAYVDTVAQLREDRQLLDDPLLAARVAETVGRVVAAAVTQYPETADWDWSVALIDDPETVNAWCMAGGRMAIYSGIVYKLGMTDDELANVLGHEVSHAVANHTAERMSMALITELGLLAVAANNDDPETRLATEVAAMVAVTLPNSRAGESEADRMGIELAARAGYDPAAGASLWLKMEEEGGSNPLQFLSTHPSPDNRREALLELATQVRPLMPTVPPEPYPIEILTAN